MFEKCSGKRVRLCEIFHATYGQMHENHSQQSNDSAFISSTFLIAGDSKTSVCDADDLLCYTAAMKKHRMRHSKRTPNGVGDECTCSRACVSVWYEAELVELAYIYGHYGPNG